MKKRKKSVRKTTKKRFVNKAGCFCRRPSKGDKASKVRKLRRLSKSRKKTKAKPKKKRR